MACGVKGFWTFLSIVQKRLGVKPVYGVKRSIEAYGRRGFCNVPGCELLSLMAGFTSQSRIGHMRNETMREDIIYLFRLRRLY